MKNRSFLVVLLLGVAVGCVTRPLPPHHPGPVTRPGESGATDDDTGLRFIVMADMPYSAAEQERLAGPIKDAIAGAAVSFLIHAGDFKSGGEACTDALIEKRHDEIYGLMPNRVFYTPGDNEWTDCDRSSLGDKARSELERLDFLRGTFFDQRIAVPAAWGYARQPNFPENARWIVDDVMFVTVHVVSTNNGRVEILRDDIEAAIALTEARDHANRVWLTAAFAEALNNNAAAIVIATQADVTAPGGAGNCCCGNKMACDAFADFRAQLRRAASKFRDRGAPLRPVLLIHGDTNPYCWDRDFGGQVAPNLQRLNVWGDFKSPGDVTLLLHRPGNRDAPFDVRTLVEGETPDATCD